MRKLKFIFSVLISFSIILGILAACTGMGTETADIPAATLQLATEIQPTTEPTLQPTPELEPTLEPTPLPSLTPIPALAVVEFHAWCMPEKFGIAPVVSSAALPENGRTATLDGDVLTLLYPDSVCVFSFTFNQSAPDGMSLEWLYRSGSESPWWTIDLQPDPTNPQTLFGTTTHSYIINPPLWFIDYRLQLHDSDGAVLWEAPMHLERDWQPELCWNGVLPNPVTLLCIKQQDLHPWDPGYCMFNTCH